ncbi:hypothetical protein Q664_27285 [Archangium violaceum Cb vi76]|uniref:Uncharacterized protein n=2 Tax=Archangium violaceum TaxID=83451 RepID=A0A084SQ36_9BACT|nr:hypothetical protein Q664_27285 [Archangium violaceum Cb vi76]
MLLCVVILAIFNSGCVIHMGALFNDISETVKDAMRDTGPAPVAWYGIDFRDTELYGLFGRYESFNSLASFDQQFPRVALTVIDVPPNHFENFMDPTKSCWRLRAKIWQSMEEYKFVEPFHWCSPRDLLPASVPVDSVEKWFSIKLLSFHTGNIRQEGPMPPESALPTDLKHQEFWRSSSFSTNSMNGKMLVSLLYHMGFDWTNLEDRRVWIVEFSQTRWDSPSNR